MFISVEDITSIREKLKENLFKSKNENNKKGEEGGEEDFDDI